MSSKQINLNQVRAYCAGYQSLRLHMAIIPGEGWTGGLWDQAAPVDEQVQVAINMGATYFNFEIRDQSGQLRYPDFGIREVTSQQAA